MKIKKHIILLIVLISSMSIAKAGTAITTNKLSITSALASGAALKVQDPGYIWEDLHAGGHHTNHTYEVRLRYGREGKTDVVRPGNQWLLKVDYALTYSNGPGPGSGSLLIKYDGSGATSILESVNQYTPTSNLTDATLTITGVSVVNSLTASAVTSISPGSSLPSYIPSDITIELAVVATQNIKLEETSLTSSFSNAISNASSTINLTWDYIAGAESYDVEWVFIEAEDENIGSIDPDPTHNTPYYPFSYKDPVRINTTDQHYEVDKSYSAGQLYFRYRGVGTFIQNCGTDYTHTQYGPWHVLGSMVPILETDFDQQTTSSPEFTWLIKKNYAEGGKNKKVVTYYDGTNRSRQSLTNLSTNETTAAAETLYDHEGRPVVNILPVPLNINSLKFQAGLHTISTSTTAQMASDDFDGSTSPPALNGLQTGAGNYYSANMVWDHTANPNLYDINQGYVPQAGGFAYTQVVYKNDNTKRIDHQSGVGADYKVNSDKATAYYYGNTNEYELGRLFGTNVGAPSHYKKNMVKDANGQVSVSYLDQEGRTIATALAGDVPKNVNDIGASSQSVTVDLAKNNHTDDQTHSYVSDASFINTSVTPQNVSFAYNINDNNSTCYNCSYKLTVSIKDPNGNGVPMTGISGGSGSSVYDNTTYVLSDQFAPLSSCSAAPWGILNFSATFSVLGEYKVSKVLTVVEPDLATATAAVAGTLQPLSYYLGIVGAEPQFDPKQCSLTCEDSCNGDPNCVTACKQFHTEYALDQNLKLECEGLLAQMKTQVSPGGIYYDLWIPPTPAVTLSSNCSPANVLQTNETNGNILAACSLAVAAHAFPNALNGGAAANAHDALDSLKARETFNPDYADILVRFHPEYCHYVMCSLTTASRKYDDLMAMEDNWDAANDNTGHPGDFYTNPVNNTVNTALNVAGNASTNPDPVLLIQNFNPSANFPNSSGATVSFNSSGFRNALDTYFSPADNNGTCGTIAYSNPNYTISVTAGNRISLWDYVDYNTTASGTCGGNTFTFHSSDLYSGIAATDAVAISKRKWQLFRGFYKDKKELYLNSLAGDLCSHYYAATNTGSVNSPGQVSEGFLETSSYDACDYAVCRMPNFTPAVTATGNGTFTTAVAGQAEVDACKGQRFANANNFMNKLYYVGMPPDIHLPACSLAIATLLYPGSSTPLPPPTVVNGVLTNLTTYPAAYQDIYNAYLNFDNNYCDFLPQNINNSSSLTFVPPIDNIKLTSPLSQLYILNSRFGTGFANSCLIPSSDCNTRVFYWVSQLKSKCSGLAANSSDLATVTTDFTNLCAAYSNIFNDLVLTPYMVSDLRAASDPYIASIDAILASYGCSSVEDLVSDGPTGSPCNVSSSMVNIAQAINNQLTTGSSSNPTVTVSGNYLNVSAPSGCSFAFYDACGEIIDPSMIASISGVMYSNLYPSGAAPNNSNLNFANVSVMATLKSSAWPFASYSCIEDHLVTTGEYSANPTFNALGVKGIFTLPLYIFNNNCGTTTVCPPDPLAQWKTNCIQQLLNLENAAANTLYQQALAAAINQYMFDYINHCKPNETFNCTYSLKEYHYTLYYYDQAGNLVQTVPPAGVSTTNTIHPAQPTDQPNHSMKTVYTYNSLNQVIAQRTPDAGADAGYTGGNTGDAGGMDDRMTQFWYNRKGQLRFSQNAGQRQAGGKYSFTCYDELGRIVIVGEVTDQGHILSNALGTTPNLDYLDLLEEPFTSLGSTCASLTYTYYENYSFAPSQSSGAPNCLPAIAANINNSRGRVLQVLTLDNTSSTYPTAATSYAYDIEGNVSDVSQYVHGYDAKLIHYDYDLLSGKVNQVSYQPNNEADQFYHKYDYDADNRITNAYTSHDGAMWEEDAEYFYYPHGPLARTEIGEDKLQGLDYYYSIEGWLKGVNMPGDRTKDPGRDAQSGLNQYIPADEHNFSLHYYDGDYTPAWSSAAPSTQVASAFTGFGASIMPPTVTSGPKGLFNGNISGMIVDIPAMASDRLNINDPLIANAYQYDQLNRIIQSQPHRYASGSWQSRSTTATTSGAGGEYDTWYQYDPNGNIQNLVRWGSTSISTGTPTGDLLYTYSAHQNRLQNVTNSNAASALTASLDIKNSHDYYYDYNGNLTSDATEGIAEIDWNVYGKITDIKPVTSSGKSTLHFDYDGAGNRVSKIVTPPTGPVSSTYYIRDASGNIMTTYTTTASERTATRSYGRVGSTSYTLRTTITNMEYPLYGSSRLGEYKKTVHEYYDVTNSTILLPNPFNINTYDFAFADDNDGAIGNYNRILTHKNYELDDHLGNVLVTLNDFRLGKGGSNPNVAASYSASANTVSDYYPFGMPMPGRQYSTGSYRFGFNGMEKDDETRGSGNDYATHFRHYDPRLGRWMSVDPEEKGHEFESSYCGLDNNPISIVDPNGDSGWDQILGAAVGLATNVLPVGGPASSYLRESASRVVSDPKDYNGTLQTVDHATFVVGNALMKVGAGGTAGGLAIAASGAVATVSTGGLSTPVSGPVVAVGLEVAVAGTEVGVTGAYLTANSTLNGKAGYHYGEKPAQTHSNCEQTKANTEKQANNASKPATSKSGKSTEPTLPNKTVAKENGVTVQHYYKSGDHAPAHLHVQGQGSKTRIGANGKPLNGNPELSVKQKEVVDANKSAIRSAANKINQYMKYHKYEKNN